MRVLFAVIALAAQLPAQQDSTWRDHDRAAREARLGGDWAASRAHVERMEVALAGHPALIAALARASAHLGDTARVVRELERLGSAGVWYDVETDSALSLVRSSPAVAGVVAKLRVNLASAGTFTPVATLPEADFVAEGIVWDPGRRRFYVSSIRHRRIDAVSRDGSVARFIDLARDSALSPLGLAIDPQRNRLWVSTERTPIGLNLNPADSGRSAVLRYELSSRKLRARYELPRGGGPHEPGDIAVASNGDLFVSDGRAGVVYVIRDGRSLDTLVRSGPLVSPQGLAPDTDGKRVFVADYALGIVSFDRGTGAVTPVPRPANVAANGVDGLILFGNSLIGVQNGVTPNRLVAFDLDGSHSRIIGARTLVRDTTRIREPTHLVAVGGEVFYIANGGFGVYDERGVLRAGVTQAAPVVARLTPMQRR